MKRTCILDMSKSLYIEYNVKSLHNSFLSIEFVIVESSINKIEDCIVHRYIIIGTLLYTQVQGRRVRGLEHPTYNKNLKKKYRQDV